VIQLQHVLLVLLCAHEAQVTTRADSTQLARVTNKHVGNFGEGPRLTCVVALGAHILTNGSSNVLKFLWVFAQRSG
jgi:hypothetical protein